MNNNIKPAKDAADAAYAAQNDKINKVADAVNNYTNQVLTAGKNFKAAQDMHDAAVNAQTKADLDLAKARNNKTAADKLAADAQSAMDTAEDLLDQIPSYIHGDNPSDNNDHNTPSDENKSDEDANKPAADKNANSEATPAAKDNAVTMTRAEYREAQQNAAKSNTLPQTGNNESAAVVALGAVSAMLGLGLAAKKREF